MPSSATNVCLLLIFLPPCLTFISDDDNDYFDYGRLRFIESAATLPQDMMDKRSGLMAQELYSRLKDKVGMTSAGPFRRVLLLEGNEDELDTPIALTKKAYAVLSRPNFEYGRNFHYPIAIFHDRALRRSFGKRSFMASFQQPSRRAPGAFAMQKFFPQSLPSEEEPLVVETPKEENVQQSSSSIPIFVVAPSYMMATAGRVSAGPSKENQESKAEQTLVIPNDVTDRSIFNKPIPAVMRASSSPLSNFRAPRHFSMSGSPGIASPLPIAYHGGIGNVFNHARRFIRKQDNLVSPPSQVVESGTIVTARGTGTTYKEPSVILEKSHKFSSS